MGDHFCLKWNNHQENLTGIMTKLLDEQKFVDVSLVCEMKTFKAHQTVLSACSPYFEQVLEENPHPHPIIILRDVKEGEMTALLQYMYRGEVSVRDDELSGFLHTARALKVRGLCDSKKEMLVPQSRDDVSQPSYVPQSDVTSPPKRQKTMPRSMEQDIPEKQLSDSQPPRTASPVCKSSSKPPSTASVPEILTYSENSNEVNFSDTPVHQNTIKQEVESVSLSSEEQSAISHHLAEVRGLNEVHNASGTSLTATFTDPGGTDIFDGSKQWQIKYAFEKVEGSGFKCKICGQIKKHVRNHYLKHFPEHHECPVCRRTYTRKDNLNSHLKRDHLQRVKTPPDPYHRLKRFSKKFQDYQGLKCLTPDIFSHVKYSSGIHPTSILGTHGSTLQSHSSPVSLPMDLSLRPSSVPVQNQYTPIYDILPSFYNYFRT